MDVFLRKSKIIYTLFLVLPFSVSCPSIVSAYPTCCDDALGVIQGAWTSTYIYAELNLAGKKRALRDRRISVSLNSQDHVMCVFIPPYTVMCVFFPPYVFKNQNLRWWDKVTQEVPWDCSWYSQISGIRFLSESNKNETHLNVIFH